MRQRESLALNEASVRCCSSNGAGWAFLSANPDRVRQCSQQFRALKVNRKTLSLFGARDLMVNLDQV